MKEDLQRLSKRKEIWMCNCVPLHLFLSLPSPSAPLLFILSFPPSSFPSPSASPFLPLPFYFSHPFHLSLSLYFSLTILLSLTTLHSHTPVPSSSMISTIVSFSHPSPTWRPCVFKPWPSSTVSASKRLVLSMTRSSLSERWHWYICNHACYMYLLTHTCTYAST